MSRRISRTNREEIALAKGCRSGIEMQIRQQLENAGIVVSYESHKIPYIGKPHSYTPDFVLPNGIIIETKGYFVPEDRTKHLLIKQQHPALDIRFVFQNPKNRLNKNSNTTYGMWCTKNGFLFAARYIPVEWLQEPFVEKRYAAIHEFEKPH